MVKNVDMKSKSEVAVKLFKQGYNCAHSGRGAFHSEIGMSFEDAIKLASSFGGGMGRMREVCGAVSAMFMVAGIRHGYIAPNDDIVKEKHYTLIQNLADKFKNDYGTIICRELLETDDNSPKPSVRTAQYYAERPCENFIATAAKIISENLL